MLRNVLLILVALCVSSALCSPPVWGAGEESLPESGDALKKAREDLRKKDDESTS